MVEARGNGRGNSGKCEEATAEAEAKAEVTAMSGEADVVAVIA